MEWRDQGMILSVRTHGESAAIIEVFTVGHGRHAGVVRGGASRRIAPLLQPGAQVDLTWRARLDDHIGAYTVEPLASRASLMSDRAALAALNAVCGLLCFALAEREPHPGLYLATLALLDRLALPDAWAHDYLRWELTLLDDLGYGLDLSSCAVTGSTEDLAYVSPKTGRAVSRAGAGDWADRLLPLPPFLTGTGLASPEALGEALGTTGHFLARFAADHGDKPLPEARARLAAILSRTRR
jgi:DNA repair protein RecO (recombination protein O)